MRSVEQLTSSDGVKVFRALERSAVLDAVRAWAQGQKQTHPELTQVGLFGSYARNRQAPGSDLDLLLVVTDCSEPKWFLRAAGFDTGSLPIGADLFVYTEAELSRMKQHNLWMQHVLEEVVWLG